jgi:hypothetical protein
MLVAIMTRRFPRCLQIGVVVLATFVILGASSWQPVRAARKAVSATEVNGTFRSADGKTTLRLFSLGRGGLDNPGFGLQVEFQVTQKKNAWPMIFGGYGTIRADRASFSPTDTSDLCDLTLSFVKKGSLTVRQSGSRDLDRPATLAGSYMKISGKEPAFSNIISPKDESLFATFVGGTGSNTYDDILLGSQVRGYKVEVKAGQVLSLSVTPQTHVYLSLFEPNGELAPDSGGVSELTGKIEVSGLYEVKVELDSPYRRHFVEYDYNVTIGVQNQK